jgi:hypothetical protein
MSASDQFPTLAAASTVSKKSSTGVDFTGLDHFGIRETMDISLLAVGLGVLNFTVVILILPFWSAIMLIVALTVLRPS